MALSTDQAALLRLVAGGQDFARVADVLGIEPAEARARAHRALAELAGVESLPPEVADALLGHGAREALGPGSAVARDSETDDAARRAAAALAELAPGAPVPRPAELAGPGMRAGPRRMLFAAGAAVALVVLAVVLISGSADDGVDPPGAGGTADEEQEVVIPLSPVGDAAARGEARLIRVEDLPVLALDLRRLEPSGAERTYIVWLYNSPRQAFPVGFRPVGPDGRISGVVPVPAGAASLLPEFRALDVSLADTDQAARTIRRAERSGGAIPEHAGRSVLRGELRSG